MKQGSTLFLRVIIIILGVIVLIPCIFVLPTMWIIDGSEEFPAATTALFIIMLGLYATVIPFFIALWQGIKLLNYIDQNKAFSQLSVTALKNNKYCAIIISILYIGGLPLLYPIAEMEDAPGLLIIGMVIACAPIAVAVFAAVLQRLLQNAIDIKSENDLTV